MTNTFMSNLSLSLLRDKVSKNFRRSSFIILAVALIVSGFFVFTALAETHTTSVSVTPTYVDGGSTDTYTFTITNNGTDSIFKITINIPAGSEFAIDTDTISCPSGWTKDGSSSSSKAVCLTTAFGDDVLTDGDSVDVSFDATSPTPELDTEYTWSVVTKDQNAGYEYTNNEAETTVDVTPPTTTDDAPVGWVNYDITVTLTCDDGALGSGCDKTYYCVDTTDTCTPTTEGNSVIITNEDKNYLRYYSKDKVGNTESPVKSTEVKIDKTAPDSTVTSPPGDEWQNEEFETTVSDVDPTTSEVSGLDKCYYRVYNAGDTPPEFTERDCSTGPTIAVPETCSVQGVNKCILNVYATDKAGNEGNKNQGREFDIDYTSPTVGEINVDPTVYGSGPYTNDNPIVTAEITDEGGSGIASCQWILTDLGNGGPWEGAGEWDSETGICTGYPELPESPLPESPLADGHTYSFNIKGIDNAENEGSGSPVERTVDATPPTISNENIEPLVEGSGPYGKGTLTASADVSDAVAGVKSVKFTLFKHDDYTQTKYCDGSLVSGDDKLGKWSCDIDTLEPLPDGDYDFKVNAEDRAGNLAESFFDVFFTLDNTPPTTEKWFEGPIYGNYLTTKTLIGLLPSDNTGVHVTWFTILVPSDVQTDHVEWYGEETKMYYKTNGDCVTAGNTNCRVTYWRFKGELLENEIWMEGKIFDVGKGWFLYYGQDYYGLGEDYGLDYFVIPQESTHKICYFSIDKLGNEEEIRCQVHYVDDSTPVTEKTYEGPYYSYDGKEWINFNTTIILSATDTQPHPVGVHETKYRYYLCGETPSPEEGWVPYTSPFTISQQSCHVIEYYSVDNLGNTEEPKSQDVYIENTPPVLTKQVGKPKFPPIEFQTIGDGTAGWSEEEKYSGSYSAKLYVQDGSKDMAAIEFDVDVALKDITELSFWQKISNLYGVNVILGIDADGDGVYESQDKPWHFSHDPADLGDDSFIEMDGMSPSSGNWEEVDTLTISQWWTPNNVGDGFCPEFGWNYLSDIQSLSKCRVDPTDHVKVIRLLIGGSGSWMDKIAYVDDIILNEKIIVLEPQDFWITQDTPITLTCHDPEPHPSNNVKIWYRYKVDDGAWTSWVDPMGGYKEIRFPEDSLHTLEYYCGDALGNNTGVHTQTYYVDTQAPVTTKTYGEPYYEGGDGNEWITSDTSITLTAIDPEPHPVRVNETKYRVYLCGDEPGGWSVYSGPFNISEESCHVIEYYSADLLGNTENVKSQTVFVDNTPPELEKIVGDPNIEEYYITTSTPITLTCEDPVTGNHPPVNNVEIWYRYWVDETLVQEWTLYTGTIYFPEESYHYLEYYCEDALGNKAEPYEQAHEVDNTPPESYTESPELATAGADEVQVAFNVYWSGEDNKVGIEKFDLWVKDGEGNWTTWTPPYWDSYYASYLGTIGHTYCFKSRATDYLGNVEPDKDVGDEGVSCTDVAAYSFDIHLIQGWNLISLPVVPSDKDTPDVLGEINDNLSGVWTYDLTNPAAIDGWLSYAPGVPSNLTSMTAGYGYWIEMLNDETLTVVGSMMAPGVTPPQRTLVPGWNLIGYYGVNSEDEYPACWDEPWCGPVFGYGKQAYDALYSLVNTYTEMPRWASLWTFYEGRFYQVWRWDNMDPGAGYWIAMGSDLPEVIYVMSEGGDW